MNHQEIIAKKIEFLNGHSSQDITPELQAIIDADHELKTELNFIESVWAKDSVQSLELPTANMDARFYQMLSQAQAFPPVQMKQQEKVNNKGLLGILQQLLSPQPVAQLALLAMLFMGGWIAKDYNQPVPTNLTAKLENQIDSLNVMVALSMLQNQSTTERLAGVNYAKESRISDKKITQVLFNILNSDRSHAVRLAAIDVLSVQASNSAVQVQLLDSLNESQSTMVQASIARLLINNSNTNHENILDILNSKSLDEDVISYLKQQNKTDNTNQLDI